MAGQELALGAQQGDCEGSRAATRMCLIPEQLARDFQVGDRGIAGHCGPRTPASSEIDGNDRFPLSSARRGADATVQLVGDDVDFLAHRFRSYVSCEGHANTKMQSWLVFGRSQRIGGLLYPIMHEFVEIIETLYQFET